MAIRWVRNLLSFNLWCLSVLEISNGRYYYSLWTVLWFSISLASRQATLTQITSTFNAIGTRCSAGQFSVPYLSWDMEVEKLPG